MLFRSVLLKPRRGSLSNHSSFHISFIITNNSLTKGSNTVITQIVADAIQTDINSIELVGPDTDLTPDAGKTSASRQTFISGGAASLAGKALREKILRHANVGENARIKSGPTGLYIEDSGECHQVDLGRLPFDEFGYVLSVQESYDPVTTPLDENGQGDPYGLYGVDEEINMTSIETSFSF